MEMHCPVLNFFSQILAFNLYLFLTFFLILYVTITLYQVLYKSRCDNRLNEITERVSGDKREVPSTLLHVFAIIDILLGLFDQPEKVM